MNASALIRGAVLACGLLLTAACSAQGGNSSAKTVPAASTHFTVGDQYVKLKPPAGQAAPSGPIEVVEVFSYGCPHCAEFAPYMDKLRADLPKNVQVRYMPAVFSQAWEPYAQAFYAARQLGAIEQTHDAFFKAVLEHYPLNSLQDMATWYGRHGVDPQKFMAAATSAETTRQMATDQRTEMGWGVDATPTLVIGRRASSARDAPFVAQMRSANIDSYAQLQQLGLWMVRDAEKR